MSWHDRAFSAPYPSYGFPNAGEVYLCLLNKHSFTVLIDLLFLPRQAAHPKRVAIVEDQTLVIGKHSSVILKNMRAFLIFPEFE